MDTSLQDKKLEKPFGLWTGSVTIPTLHEWCVFRCFCKTEKDLFEYLEKHYLRHIEDETF